MSICVRYLLPIAAAAMLGGCGIQESYKVSGAEAEHFHAAMSAGNSDQIWDSAAPGFRSSHDKAQFAALLDAIGRKLGKVKEAKQTGWNANSNNGVSTVTIKFDTTFERGSGQETIAMLWVSDKSLKLLDYKIDSQEMLIK